MQAVPPFAECPISAAQFPLVASAAQQTEGKVTVVAQTTEMAGDLLECSGVTSSLILGWATVD